MSAGNFSSAVILSDLNDFISPTLECIKPIEGAPQVAGGMNEVEKEGEGEGPDTNTRNKNGEKVEINLTDCLACSGCITSAESVLISIQSNQEFYRVLNDRIDSASAETSGIKLIAVSISSQSRASLANKWGLSRDQVWCVLYNMFMGLGVDYVFDIDFARDISLLASGCEFMARFAQSKDIPVLASSCPGWVCYAEKTHPAILPHMDSTKSPQQIMGSIVKDFVAKKLQVGPNQIYHLCIMPCYDKKLEASRSDFYNDIYSSRDVDLVLSTIEVEQMLVEKNIDLQSIPKSIITGQESNSVFPLVKVLAGTCMLASSGGSSSGGYLEWVLRYAVKTLYQVILSPQDIQQGMNGVSITPGRNADFTTVTYTPPGSGAPTLTFAYVYGFKNIQNLVRKLKAKNRPSSSSVSLPPFHFVEVMACPKGCINGGAQARHDAASLPSKEWIQATQDIYSSQPSTIVDPSENAGVHQLLMEWMGSGYADMMRMQVGGGEILHTKFHAVANNLANPNAGLAVKW